MPERSRSTRRVGRPRRWPWLALAGALVAALGAGWVGRPDPGADAAAGGWVPFRPPDGSFAVLGPASPSVSDVPSAVGTEHEVRFPAPDGEVLALEWVDVVPQASAGLSEGDLMAAWANGVVRDVGGVLDRQDVLRAGSHPGVGLRLESGGRSVYLRVFAVGGRLYEVAAVLPLSAPSADRAASQRFVDSFELLV